MFRDYRRLGRWEQTDDICQNASMRLWNALKAARPATPAEFHRLAALQIRRELIDQV
ncbi:MAG: polymerase subunit sigma-70 [Planctomycetota bacterium]|nr:polymerase subunit sigma-70 [Planctomycetota bacterium]